MRSFITVFAAILFFSVQYAIAQNWDDPRTEMNYVDIPPIETDEVRMVVSRAHSQGTFTQFTAQIFNKTNDYILIKKHEVKFISESKDYGEKTSREKIIFIEPKGDITRTFKVVGSLGFRAPEINVVLDGFSRASLDGEKTEGGSFKMKPDKNSKMIGPFAVTLRKWRFNHKELSADFKIRYRGEEGIGIVSESDILIRKEDGSVVENTRERVESAVLAPMQTITLTVVRPFAKDAVGKRESVFVVWDEALLESKSEPFEVPGFRLVYEE